MARTEEYDRRRTSGSRTSGSSGSRYSSRRIDTSKKDQPSLRDLAPGAPASSDIRTPEERAYDQGVEQYRRDYTYGPLGEDSGAGGGGYGSYGGGGYGGGGGGGPSQYDIQKEAAQKAIQELQELYTGGSYRAAEDLLIGAIGEAQQRDVQSTRQTYDQLLQSVANTPTSEAFGRIAGGQTGATRGQDPLSQKFRGVGQDLDRSEKLYKRDRRSNANEARAYALEEVRAAAAAGRLAANMKAAERANALADQIIGLAVQYGLDIPDMSGMMADPTRQAFGGM